MNASNGVRRFFAPQAWVQGAWAQNVLLTVAADGTWQSVQPAGISKSTSLQNVPDQGQDQDQDPAGITLLKGAVLPGLVNAHSHAFQRAMAGLTERRSTGAAHASDDFWSWRDRMYTAANRITPEQLEATACLLYAELLMGGYTHVCEFHYLHNDINGAAYANPVEMSLALVRAAQRTGMGLTLLPTLYMRSGFTATSLREDQRRFASTPDSVMRMVEAVQKQVASDPGNLNHNINTGVAIHSLRAVSPQAMNELTTAAKERGLPVHIHIAEQTQEVDDCIAHTGQRPIEWLLNHADVDARWNLVHATHATPAELQGVQQRDASIVICPATEANLGDGVFDLPAYAAAGGRWSIGSDSHVTRSWPEELRLLEYSQRLNLRQRNIAARVLGHESSAAALFEAALAGGGAAIGQAQLGLAAGQRADFLVVDLQASALLGVPADHVLDALVFSSPCGGVDGVFVAGRAVVFDGVVGSGSGGELWAGVVGGFKGAMDGVWGSGR